jgi:hypothetical protein
MSKKQPTTPCSMRFRGPTGLILITDERIDKRQHLATSFNEFFEVS